jgi:superfamily II DNA/RNA helicase
VVAPKSAGWTEFKNAGKPQALVIVPTRELAIQVADDLSMAGANLGIRVLSLYGGRAYEPQIEAINNGIEVIVGTPGRLIDLIKQNYLDLSQIKVLVMDEADEMLDMGFLPDVEKLVSKCNSDRQTMLFSATMPGQIVALSKRYMTQPTHIRAVDPTSESSIVDAIEQHVWRCHQMDKPELVARILQAEGRGLTIIFCRTKRVASTLSDDLASRGFAVGAVHGDLGQGAREQALRAFRSGKIDILVATDVAARGIDVADVTHVINYECPDDEKTYTHRVGRTGRAGNSGVAITFVDWQDTNRWQMINRALGLAFNEPIETYSSSDHVYSGLNIPKTVTGKLPTAQRERAGLDAEKLEDLGETGAQKGKQAKSKPAQKSAPKKPVSAKRDSQKSDTDKPRAPREKRERTRTRKTTGS